MMATVIFIPGLLCNERLFYPQIKALKTHTNINILIADTTGLDTISALAERIIASCKGDMIVVGLSMGGYIAMEILRLDPKRVIGLGLLSTGAYPDTKERYQQRQDLITLSTRGKFKGVTPRLLPLLLSPQAVSDDDLCKIVMEMAADIGQENFVHQQHAIMHRVDQHKILQSYKAPALVICGLLDQLTPPILATTMADCLEDAELLLIPEVGHLSSLEAPIACSNAIIRMVNRAILNI